MTSPELDKAVNWLKKILAGVDSMPSKEMFEMAKKEGIKPHTLKNAKKEAAIQSIPVFVEGILKSWLWKLPKDEKKTPMLPGFKSESAQGKENTPMIKMMFQSKETPKLSDSQKETLESNGFRVGPLEL